MVLTCTNVPPSIGSWNSHSQLGGGGSSEVRLRAQMEEMRAARQTLDGRLLGDPHWVVMNVWFLQCGAPQL